VAVSSAGTVSVDPRVEFAVIDPLVTITRSRGPIGVSSAFPPRVQVMAWAVSASPGARRRSVTRVPSCRVTPWSVSHFSSGRTMESNWLNLVR
jgi:hypothetical protein